MWVHKPWHPVTDRHTLHIAAPEHPVSDKQHKVHAPKCLRGTFVQRFGAAPLHGSGVQTSLRTLIVPEDTSAVLLPAACRITFYLAQTLMAIARHEEAYGWYEKRVALGGWHVSGR